MATRFIEGAATMTPDGFRSDPGSVRRAGEAFRRLHTSGARFPFTFELFAMIDDYLGILSTKDVTLPEGYHDVVSEAQSIRAALSANPAELVACHCDPLCENFLDTGEQIYIVDWEYSGMNDPMWDLGDLSVKGDSMPARIGPCLRPISAVNHLRRPRPNGHLQGDVRSACGRFGA
jgi:thiamine kinase-like enzyme